MASNYEQLVKALRCNALSKQCDSCKYGYHLCPDSECNDACNVEQVYADAAAAIEELQAEVKDLNEALKSESAARQNAETKRYCCNCAHMDASMYDEAWYGICKLNDFEVEAIHGWGCTDWAKMEVQE